MLEYLIPIISFAGIFLGVLLKKVAREEVKFGKFGPKYFVWMKRIILFLIIVTLLALVESYIYLFLGIVIGLIIGVFLSEYLFLGVALVIGFMLNNNVLLIISSLSFLYGLPYGSILRKIKLNHILFVTILFFVPFLLLLTNIDLSLLIGISAGGLFHYIIRK